MRGVSASAAYGSDIVVGFDDDDEEEEEEEEVVCFRCHPDELLTCSRCAGTTRSREFRVVAAEIDAQAMRRRRRRRR